MTSKNGPIVVGTATLQPVDELVRAGVPRHKAVKLKKENAARRLRKLRTTEKHRTSNRVKASSQKRPKATARLLVGKNLWSRITQLVAHNPSDCLIASAFLGGRISNQLPVAPGSVLVVNADKRIVGQGLTNPYEIERLVRAGVEVHNRSDLHAKVFVFPNCAVVGSMNISRESQKQGWAEAAAEIRSRGVVRECRKFVRSMCGDPLEIGYLDDLKEIWDSRPDLVGGDAAQELTVQTGESLWMVKLDHEDLDQFDREAEARGEPVATRQISSDEYELDSFCTFEKRFRANVQKHDFVSQMLPREGQFVLYAPARVLHCERYEKADGSLWIMAS